MNKVNDPMLENRLKPHKPKNMGIKAGDKYLCGVCLIAHIKEEENK